MFPIIVLQNGRNAGQKMAVITLQDRVGSIECVLFTEAFAANAELVQTGSVVFAEGHIDHKRGEPQIILRRLYSPDRAASCLAGLIEIDLEPVLSGDDSRSSLELVSGLLKQSGARSSEGAHLAEIGFRVPVNGCSVQLRAGNRVVVEPHLIAALRSTIGRDNAVRVHGRKPAAAPKKKSWRSRN